MQRHLTSKEAFDEAIRVIPGGVNSPVRAFRSVEGIPPFIASGKGAHITDIEGNTYIDFVASWGPLLFGHAHPAITEAIKKAADNGTSFGAPTLGETELAQRIVAMVPSIEKVRLVNSGTEATMSAIRLARGFTGRELIVKFKGCYHGHADSFLIAAGSGAMTMAIPDSGGVTAGTARDTLLARYNDLDSVQKLFDEHGSGIAAVIVEPVAGNMGVVPPKNGFLCGLRAMTLSYGSLLIFDEVITGFRLSKGGAQEYYQVTPDLTTLGKIIGGGLPVGAYGGKAEIMDMVAPLGPVYQAGTLSGNPLAVAAGLAMLSLIEKDPSLYLRLETKAQRLEEGMKRACTDARVAAVINRVGSMMTLFFSEDGEIFDYDSAKTCDTRRYARFFHALLSHGVYIAPSQFEAAFVSDALSDDDIAFTQKTMAMALKSVA